MRYRGRKENSYSIPDNVCSIYAFDILFFNYTHRNNINIDIDIIVGQINKIFPNIFRI